MYIEHNIKTSTEQITPVRFPALYESRSIRINIITDKFVMINLYGSAETIGMHIVTKQTRESIIESALFLGYISIMGPDSHVLWAIAREKG